MDIEDNNYYVVEFLRPRDNIKYAIVPRSWIKLTNKKHAVVVYPEEDQSITIKRIRRCEQCKENWKDYEATIIYSCSHFDDAYWKLTTVEYLEDDDQASKEQRPKTDHNNSPGNSRGNVTTLTNNIPIRNGNSIRDNKGDILTQAQKRTISNYDQDTPSTSKIRKTDIKHNNNGSQNKKQTFAVESTDITNTETSFQRNPVIMRSSISSHHSIQVLENITVVTAKHLLGVPIKESSQETDSIPSASKQISSPPANYSRMQTENLYSQKHGPLHPISVDEKLILKKGSNTSTVVRYSPNIPNQDHYESMTLKNQDSGSNKIVKNLLKADNQLYQLSNRLPNQQEQYDKSSYSEQLLPNTEYQYQESYSQESASNLPTNINRKDSHIENILIDVQTPSKSINDFVKHNSPNAQNTSNEEPDNGRSYKKDFILQSDSQSLTEQSITNEELPIAESTSYQETSTVETPVEKPNEESHGEKITHPGNDKTEVLLQSVIKLPDILQNRNKTEVANNEIVNNNNNIPLEAYETIQTTNKNIKLDETSTPTTSTDTTEISKRRKISKPKDIQESSNRANSRRNHDTKKRNNRKRCSRSLVLPRPSPSSEYHPRWTLKHPYPGSGITELVTGSHVYVSTSGLDHSTSLAKDAESLAILLLMEIFSDNALRVCTLTATKRGLHLDQDAKKALLIFVAVIHSLR
ncbi:hypothetical protein K1T71_006988 [Dendrolimus kikuchii]|uniref:Uncharacterized protein n=1 Tax=Dendrolimus kikuchii TaxID=765133 RepID=A0ACC1CZT0_9NEOP|nr:hypothetical protein K1T71_006988 [Dendrolimus kikuchii]